MENIMTVSSELLVKAIAKLNEEITEEIKAKEPEKDEEIKEILTRNSVPNK